MKEGRGYLMDRLRREGRWKEADAYRDQVRLQLKHQGMTRTEAVEESWQRMAEAFPPIQSVPYQPEGPLPEPTTEPPDPLRDILWVYAHLCDPRTTAADAPGLGAWALLHVARTDPGRFMSTMLPRAMSPKTPAKPVPEPAPPPEPPAEPDDDLGSLRDVIKSLGND